MDRDRRERGYPLRPKLRKHLGLPQGRHISPRSQRKHSPLYFRGHGVVDILRRSYRHHLDGDLLRRSGKGSPEETLPEVRQQILQRQGPCRTGRQGTVEGQRRHPLGRHLRRRTQGYRREKGHFGDHKAQPARPHESRQRQNTIHIQMRRR